MAVIKNTLQCIMAKKGSYHILEIHIFLFQRYLGSQKSNQNTPPSPCFTS